MDKSIPYSNVIMIRKGGMPILQPLMIKGYSVEPFKEGDEKNWAEIETLVGEFQNEQDALAYFRKEYLPHLSELKRRCLFLRKETGEKIGTFTIWWNFTGGKRNVSLHWLGVKPEYQGLGLGKVLVFECLKRMIQMEGNQDVYLHTQTWSYKAIGIYLQAGFEFVRVGSFGGYKNDYEEAIPILKTKLNSIF